MNGKKKIKIKAAVKEKHEEIKERNAELKEKIPNLSNIKEIKEKEKNAPLAAPKKLKALFTIVPRNKAEFYLDILEGYEANIQMVLFGTGTMPQELAAAIHTNTDKAVIISVVKEEHVKQIMNAYEDKYFKLRNGQGIAFAIPFSSMIGKMSYQFLANMEGKGNE